MKKTTNTETYWLILEVRVAPTGKFLGVSGGTYDANGDTPMRPNKRLASKSAPWAHTIYQGFIVDDIVHPVG